jgi:hypothetical protein
MKLITDFIVIKVVFCIRHELVPSESHQLALCLRNIMYQQFNPNSLILVSVPPSDDDTAAPSVQNKNSHLVDIVLKDLNSAELWPLHVFRPDIHPPDIKLTVQQTSRIHYFYMAR